MMTAENLDVEMMFDPHPGHLFFEGSGLTIYMKIPAGVSLPARESLYIFFQIWNIYSIPSARLIVNRIRPRLHLSFCTVKKPLRR